MRVKLSFYLGAFLLCVSVSFAYDVVLKSGKTIHGTLVREDDQTIVLRDDSGVQMNFKKSNIDLAKTAEANQAAAAASTEEPAAPAAAQKPAPPTAPKKPARVITEDDLIALRDKYDLGEGMTKPGDKSAVTPDGASETDAGSAPRSEAEWQSTSQELQAQAQQAEQQYQRLQDFCEKAMASTIQDAVVIQDGNPLSQGNLVEFREKVCGEAEKAKGIMEGARDRLREFLDQARKESVPPGWIRNEDGSSPEVSEAQEQ